MVCRESIKNESTPLIRRVTFKRREPFTVTATYDEAAMPELPPGTDPVIGTFTVNPTPKVSCGCQRAAANAPTPQRPNAPTPQRPNAPPHPPGRCGAEDPCEHHA